MTQPTLSHLAELAGMMEEELHNKVFGCAEHKFKQDKLDKQKGGGE